MRRKELMEEIRSNRQFNKVIKILNGEAARVRKLERNKYIDKANHSRRRRKSCQNAQEKL